MGTLASSIITDAYRESNLIPMGNSPNTNQVTEALTRLNTLILSTVGNEAGDALDDMNIGGTYDQSKQFDEYIPDNTRLVLNLSSPLTLKLDPYPFDGQRVSFVDVAGNIATNSLTLNGNGRQIEGAATLVLNTNGDTRQWMYRSDLGQWLKITTLASTDPLPFPLEFDDYFVTMLAMRLSPRYGQALAAETTAALKRSRSQLRARYHAWKQVRSDLDTRGFTSDPRARYSPSDTDFEVGRPFTWR